MASFFKVVSALGPKLVYNRTVDLKEISEWVANRSSLNKTEVQRVLSELYEVLLVFTRSGSPVRLAGVGRLRAVIKRTGRIELRFSPDVGLMRKLNHMEEYAGEIANRRHIGISNEQLKAAWDAEHPDDPMELPSGNGGGEPPIEPEEPGGSGGEPPEPEPGGGGVEPPEPEPGEPDPEPQPPSD